MSKRTKELITFELSSEEKQCFDIACCLEGKTKSQLIREAIKEIIEKGKFALEKLPRTEIEG